MNIKEALEGGEKRLAENGVEGPRASVEFLLKKILKVEKEYLHTHSDRKLTLWEDRKYRKMLSRRAKHEPVWYITGEIEFFGQDFIVNENVLIPRPETELLIEHILKTVKKTENLEVLDVGTGSGAIILTLADKLTGDFFASDISVDALEIARKNAKRLGKKVIFKSGDLLAPWLGKKFNLVVANLPYVPHEDMPSLAFDLIHHEPRAALDGGIRGLEIYERFFKELPAILAEKALVFCEIGDSQGHILKKIAEEYIPGSKTSVEKDYGNHDRYLLIEYGN